MKLTRKSLTLMLVMAVFCLSLGFGFLPSSKTSTAFAAAHDDKMIARYTLDEVVVTTEGETTTRTLPAINASGAALTAMNATTSVDTSRLIANGMEGKAALRIGDGNVTLPAFLGEAETAFSMSMWYRNEAASEAGRDWNPILNAGGGMLLALPNLDSWGAAPPYSGSNAWPSKAETPADYSNHSNWDSFLNRNLDLTDRFACNNPEEWMYVTVTVDPAVGYKMYKDGKIALTYTHDKGYGAGSTVGAYLEHFVAKAKTGGMILFGGGNRYADDIRLFKALTDEEIQGLYDEVSALNVTKIMAGSEEVKDTNSYVAVSKGVPYSAPDQTVTYVKADGENPDANKPEITFELAKILFNPTDNALLASKSIVETAVGDYTITAGTASTPVVDETAKTTTYTQDYTIKIGSTSKVIQIKFVRNDDLSEAMKTLSALRVGGALIEGFDSSVHEYTYNLTADVEAIPTVTYTATVPSLVDVTTNVAAAADFNGKTFEYVITIKDKTNSSTIGTYKITFNRASSAVINSVVVDGGKIYNFNPDVYYDAEDDETVQSAYVHSVVSAIDKVEPVLRFADTAEVGEITITSGLIKINVKDTVSDEVKTYALKQVEFENEPNYSTDLNATTVEEDDKITLQGSATAAADHVSIGNGSVEGTQVVSGVRFRGVLANNEEGYSFGNLNADGITVVTWVKMAQAPASEHAGMVYLALDGGALIANQCQRFTGDYKGAWVMPEGGIATHFVSETYIQIAIVISNNKAYYYVNGGLKDEVNLTARLTSSVDIYLGRTHVAGDPLGNGDYRDFAVYNAPLSQKTIQDLANEQEKALLTSLKIKGQTSNITGFGPQVFNYTINYSSSNTNPTLADFPELEATNGLGEVTDIVKAATVVNKSLTYTITSTALGYTNTYTVVIKFVSTDSTPVKFVIAYSGTEFDIEDEVLESEFSGTGSTKTYTYKVWEGFTLNEFVISVTLKEGQTREGTSFNNTNKTWTTTVYASGDGSTTYVINFVVDASVENPDGTEPEPEPEPEPKKGCFGTVGVFSGSFAIFALALAGIVVLKKKEQKNG